MAKVIVAVNDEHELRDLIDFLEFNDYDYRSTEN